MSLKTAVALKAEDKDMVVEPVEFLDSSSVNKPIVQGLKHDYQSLAHESDVDSEKSGATEQQTVPVTPLYPQSRLAVEQQVVPRDEDVCDSQQSGLEQHQIVSTVKPEAVAAENDETCSSWSSVGNNTNAFPVLTDAMITEEAELHRASLAEEAETKRLNMEKMRSLAQEDCYRRLKFLLEKSQRYTSYVHERMQAQREHVERLERQLNEKRQARAAAEAERKRNKADEPKQENCEPKFTRRSRRNVTHEVDMATEVEIPPPVATAAVAISNVPCDGDQENKNSQVDENANHVKPGDHEVPVSNCGVIHAVGTKLKVKYGTAGNFKIYTAKVLKVDASSSVKRYFVHYDGWKARYDVWIGGDSVIGPAEDVNRRRSKRSLGTSASQNCEVAQNTNQLPSNEPNALVPQAPGAARRGRKRKCDDDPISETLQHLTKKAYVQLECLVVSQSQSSVSGTTTSQLEELAMEESDTNTNYTSSQLTQSEGSTQESATTAAEVVEAQSNIAQYDGQPTLLTGGTLRSYQIDGFRWLKMLYENGVNGILADEMGLGKTVQCIALVSHLVANGIEGPFLVCAPLSTIPNWIAEFKRFSPKVPFVLYHGSKPDRAILRRSIRRRQPIEVAGVASSFPVVVTSYEIAMNDREFLMNEHWKLLIVDEGHRIKNFNCRLIRELKMYNSVHRLLLTGTPLQNNMAELWSLLNFLIPEIFDSLGSFETWFDVAFLESADDAHEQLVFEEQRKHTLSMLHQILTPFMLRRLKSDVDFVIPPKREMVVYAPLSSKQEEMYRCILDKTIAQLVNGPTADTESLECDANGRPIRKSRRQTIDLKNLFSDSDDEGVNSEENNDDDADYDKGGSHGTSLQRGTVSRCKSKLAADNDNDADSNKDGTAPQRVMAPRRKSKSAAENDGDADGNKDGSQRGMVSRRKSKLAVQNDNDADGDKDGTAPQQVMASRRKSKQAADNEENAKAGKASLNGMAPKQVVVSRRKSKPVAEKDDDDSDVEKWAESVIEYHRQTADMRTKKSVEDRPPVSALINIQLRNSMALLRRCCNHPYLIEYPMDNGKLRIDEQLISTCGKLMLLDRMLTQLKAGGHKVLIFSQMTQMMDILEDYCSLRGHTYCRLDGSMKMTDRQDEIGRFSDDDVFLFLLSTRAGGLGINLTQADTVVIYDSDWNPQCDLQAQDRCHRIGQVRPVMVYRLVTANTVDQKIVDRATAKRKLEKLVIHKGKFKSTEDSFKSNQMPISPQELLALLQESDYQEAMKGRANKGVISDADLLQLLDRTDLMDKWTLRLQGRQPAAIETKAKDVEGVFQVVTEVWDDSAIKSVGANSDDTNDSKIAATI